MIGFIRSIIEDRSGNGLTAACAAVPLVIGASGLAVDVIQWLLWKSQLQSAAQSAAIAGVREREVSRGSTSSVLSAVTRDLALSDDRRLPLMSGYPVVAYPDGGGRVLNPVEVRLAARRPLPFSSLFVHAVPTILVTAAAGTDARGRVQPGPVTTMPTESQEIRDLK